MASIFSFSERKKDKAIWDEYQRLMNEMNEKIASHNNLMEGSNSRRKKGNVERAKILHAGAKKRDEEIQSILHRVQSYRIRHKAALEREVNRKNSPTPKPGFIRRLFRRRAA